MYQKYPERETLVVIKHEEEGSQRRSMTETPKFWIDCECAIALHEEIFVVDRHIVDESTRHRQGPFCGKCGSDDLVDRNGTQFRRGHDLESRLQVPQLNFGHDRHHFWGCRTRTDRGDEPEDH